MTNGEDVMKTDEESASKLEEKPGEKSSKLCQLLNSECVSQYQVFVKIFLQQKVFLFLISMKYIMFFLFWHYRYS